MAEVRAHPSALRHGLTADEVIGLWSVGLEDTWLDDLDPTRLLRIGLDEAGRPWELVGLVFDSGTRHLVIHAMPLRKGTIELIRRAR
jgi:hypothetical protein